MASLVQKISRSFANTLIYIWTVIQALLSFHSPNPFPFRETSTVVPYPLDIDLENGSRRRERTRGATLVPSPAPSLALPTPSQNAIQRALDEDACLQESLRCSPAFLTSRVDGVLRIEQGLRNATLSASSKDLILYSAMTNVTLRDQEPPPLESDISEDVFVRSCNMTPDPFLDTKTTSLFAFSSRVHDYRLGNVEPAPFKLPFCTSTPPRSRKDGKGHKRAALATITNIAHLNIPVSFADSLPSPTTTEPLVDTPLMQRMCSLSLRGKPACGDLHSSSLVKAGPSKCSPPAISLGSAQEVQFKTVSPLRIVKRNGANTSGARISAMSEVSTAVTSAVRDAFIQTREEGQHDEGIAARELIDRESVWTCDAVPTGPSRGDMGVVEEGEESDEEYGEKVTVDVSCSPPPPYAFSNPDYSATLAPNAAQTMLQPVYSVPACGSSELSYLQINPSTDSCLDDILASFEHLITTMPKFQVTLVRPQDPRLSAVGELEKKGIGATPSMETQPIVPDDSYVGRVTQWSDVLQLDNY